MIRNQDYLQMLSTREAELPQTREGLSMVGIVMDPITKATGFHLTFVKAPSRESELVAVLLSGISKKCIFIELSNCAMDDFPVIGYSCFAHRILGSLGGKHCESLQRIVWR